MLVVQRSYFNVFFSFQNLHQRERNNSICIHSWCFSWYKISLVRFLMFLLRVSFIDYLSIYLISAACKRQLFKISDVDMIIRLRTSWFSRRLYFSQSRLSEKNLEENLRDHEIWKTYSCWCLTHHSSSFSLSKKTTMKSDNVWYILYESFSQR